MHSDAMTTMGGAQGRRGLVAALRQAAPPGLEEIDAATHALLRSITRELIGLTSDPEGECRRFEAQGARALPMHLRMRGCVENDVVLVTGGTGCIGSALLRELQSFSPRRIVCVSRGLRTVPERLPSVDYLQADINDWPAVQSLMSSISPDVVFHLAAQRDPGLAERTVGQSLMTNVLGTRNLLRASEECGVASFVYASTGKALRPYTPHVYAASKKLGELLTFAAGQSASATRCSVARFTHVVDNSLVLHKFRETRTLVTLHDPDILFYTQSAREAAQLLLCAQWNSQLSDSVDLVAIRDLGLPTRLLDLALAVAADADADRVVYIKGYESGYDDTFYPGLYDPETAANASPLLNAFEAAHVRDVAGLGVDASAIRLADPERIAELTSDLESVCRPDVAAETARAALNVISDELFQAVLAVVDDSLLERLVRITEPARQTLSDVNRAIDDRIRGRLRADAAV
jgi:nucleoside-diphosphate-sugar epimerase